MSMNEISEQLTETEATNVAAASVFKIKDLIFMVKK
jgi:hypothetical protein